MSSIRGGGASTAKFPDNPTQPVVTWSVVVFVVVVGVVVVVVDVVVVVVVEGIERGGRIGVETNDKNGVSCLFFQPQPVASERRRPDVTWIDRIGFAATTIEALASETFHIAKKCASS